jgi:hypothetical protein
MTGHFAVRTLMGAGSFRSSVICLRSVVACAHEPLRLIVHDDGTLTADQRDLLRTEVSPEITFVMRRDSDDAVLPRLAKHPACLAYRQISPLALKLFDIVMLNDGPMTFIDSDIFFRRTVTRLFDPSRVRQPVFMDNTTHAYAIRPWMAWPLAAVRLAGRVNTGLIVGWTAGIDLDFTEWLIARLTKNIVYHTRSYWVEQTCWAALAARTESRLFDPRQVAMASSSMSGVTSETVAIHFVSSFRQALTNYQEQIPAAGQSPIEVRTVPTRRVSSLGLLGSDLLRRF